MNYSMNFNSKSIKTSESLESNLAIDCSKIFSGTSQYADAILPAMAA